MPEEKRGSVTRSMPTLSSAKETIVFIVGLIVGLVAVGSFCYEVVATETEVTTMFVVGHGIMIAFAALMMMPRRLLKFVEKVPLPWGKK